jgi:hypothetical protein
MIGFIGTSLQLQLIIIAHTLNSFWMTSVWQISHSSWADFSYCPESLIYFPWIRVKSYVTIDCPSVSQSWNKAPIWGLQPYFYYCQTVVSLLMLGALSDERMGLSFTIAAGPCQCIILGSDSCGTHNHILLSQIRDFPFCHLIWLAWLRMSQSHIATDSQWVCLKSKWKSKSVTLRLTASQ